LENLEGEKDALLAWIDRHAEASEKRRRSEHVRDDVQQHITSYGYGDILPVILASLRAERLAVKSPMKTLREL